MHMVFSYVCTHRKMMSACMQVEFNKAAQSLTDAMIPTTQKKTALNRLVKVAYCTPLVTFGIQKKEIVCYRTGVYEVSFLFLG